MTTPSQAYGAVEPTRISAVDDRIVFDRYVRNDLLGPRLTREETQSMAVACILTDHARCDYDPDCRCECHAPTPSGDKNVATPAVPPSGSADAETEGGPASDEHGTQTPSGDSPSPAGGAS